MTLIVAESRQFAVHGLLMNVSNSFSAGEAYREDDSKAALPGRTQSGVWSASPSFARRFSQGDGRYRVSP